MSDNNIFDFETFKKQMEEVKKRLEEQREAAQKRTKDERWEDQKEAFVKMMEAYDTFLPEANVSKVFGAVAEQLEQAAEKLKDIQKAAEAADKKGEEE